MDSTLFAYFFDSYGQLEDNQKHIKNGFPFSMAVIKCTKSSLAENAKQPMVGTGTGE